MHSPCCQALGEGSAFGAAASSLNPAHPLNPKHPGDSEGREAWDSEGRDAWLWGLLASGESCSY